jgi:hypothetical protein
MVFVRRASTSRAPYRQRRSALSIRVAFFFVQRFSRHVEAFFGLSLESQTPLPPGINSFGCEKTTTEVKPRHFSHENHREAFRAVRNTPQRAPRRPHNLLHTMKTICESCCDSPATLVACGRDATVLCGTCDTPRYAPAA